MAEHATWLPAGSVRSVPGLPPQFRESSRLFRLAHPSIPAVRSVPATRYVPEIGAAPKTCSAPTQRRWPRPSRGQRLLLAGAVATGIWLLGCLCHSATAHAESATPRPAVPPLSSVTGRWIGPEQPPLRTLGHPSAAARPLVAPAGYRISLTGRRIPAVLQAPIPPTNLPAAGLPLLIPLPAPIELPVPIQLPVPPGLSVLLPGLSRHPLAGQPAPTDQPSGNRTATEPGWPAAAALIISVRPAPKPADRPARRIPHPRPAPGRPDDPALSGIGTPTRNGPGQLPLVVLPAGLPLELAGAAQWRPLEPVLLRERACRPSVFPD